jgi:hypothetical protein
LQLALAWTLANKDTSVALLGFTRLGQIDENLKALTLLEQWTPEIEAKCEEILGNTPTPELEWRTFSPGKPRRQLRLYTPPPAKKAE